MTNENLIEEAANAVQDAWHVRSIRSEVPEPSAEEFRRQIAEERERQIECGYDAEHDRAHGVDHLLRWAQDYARRGRSVQSAALIEAAREMLREGAK